MQTNYVMPKYLLEAFNCPYCRAYSSQTWLTSGQLRTKNIHIKNIAISLCNLCKESALWIEDLKSLEPNFESMAGSVPSLNQGEILAQIIGTGKMVYPGSSPAPMPVDDMPEEIKIDFLEARDIVGLSPRGAAALLRLCVQKLLPILGEKGKNIDDDIASLVRKGLPIDIQKALDSLRVIGNEAVHPGTIALNDDRQTALALFSLLNFIVERTIGQQKQIDRIYGILPKSKLDGINKRDNT